MSVGVIASSRPEHRPAIDRALEEAWLRNLDLVLLVPVPVVGSRETRYLAASKRRRDAVEFVEAQLSALRAEGVKATGVVVDGEREPLIDALLRESKHRRVEIIVVASPPRSRVGKLVLGSLVRDLVIEASVPVLVVRSKYSKEVIGE